MFKAVTQYSVTGQRGGYTLQWQGYNCPSYIIGPKNSCCWYKYKKDAVKAAAEQNNSLSKNN